MRFSFLKKRLFAPLYASFTVLVLILLAQEGLSLTVNIFKQRGVDTVTQIFKIKRESERLMGSALEEKVALRGYLINPSPTLLQQYQDGQASFQDSFVQLSSLLQDDPSQQINLIEISKFHSQWKLNFVEPILNDSFDIELMEETSSLDPLRGVINSILTYERGILSEQTQRLKQLDRLNQASLALSCLSIGVIIIGSAVNLILLRRRVVIPLQKLMEAGEAWKLGQLDTQINHASADEMGQLSQTLNGMAEGIQVRQGKIQQRNQQLADLISTLSHDLRTPLLANRSTLNAIAGGAFGTISSELREVMDDYQEANHDLINLVETLLDVNRYEAKGSQILTRDILNWQKICQRVSKWTQTSSQEKCELQINIPPDLPQASGDGIEIQRVLQNLVDNAVRLSPAASTVSIDVSLHTGKLDPGQQIQVSVKDQGPGLTEHEAQAIFYRFAQGTGRQGRAGLGLYLCRQIIEAHGGTIWAESILGQGATFRFVIPIASPEEDGKSSSSR